MLPQTSPRPIPGFDATPGRHVHTWITTRPGEAICKYCGITPTLCVQAPDGSTDVLYLAQPRQMDYHRWAIPNGVVIGPRGTGKTTCQRMDAHMRAMAVDGYRYLIIRRTMPELKKSHPFAIVDRELHRLGGSFHHTDHIARYPNGSVGHFGHCDSLADTNKYLSAEYDLVNPDEVVTFTPELILRMMACVRVPEGSGRTGLFRGGMNKLGIGAEFIKRYFVDKDVPAEENADYDPTDFDVMSMLHADNQYVDLVQYRKRLALQPEHVRRAWLDDEWIIEGQYFTDFRPTKDGRPWHVIPTLPLFQGRPILGQPWVRIYRTIDWGYSPDPCVCLWVAVLPNKRAIVFKERTWKATVASDVAREIKRDSEGLHVVETFCDPTMLLEGRGNYTIGEAFERHGVPLTPSTNLRDLYGYAIHSYFNTLIDDGDGTGPTPQLLLLGDSGPYGCPQLIRTLPGLQIDPIHPTRIADGNDHWAVALAYFCQGDANGGRDPSTPSIPRWMLPRAQLQRLLRDP